ncbi:TRAP-type mannitol/chloroaromatic compound transport system permease small subunit [Neolewinella xylanilytica]|uniref:TRAP-type mannitol/chloroaromatic compound transport system permease small subunit n=1 Tax=Neolewinella xylanilytica TaxID=1514080 RepID=A0A2S6I5H6_9BACT|nr:TRAP transporter small permease subunit [Neolewinella xylanilytica]PPK86426.1 TRAP-type mannitol/chloroaromatic compound transport system permease small subunit [Neolewinella xylanilytica]
MVDAIDRLVASIGRAVGWLNVLLIVIVVVDVLLRWFFSLTAAWVIELEWHLFSLIFLLGIPYALQQDRHVRVDLFYEDFTARDKGMVNLVGAALFLIPWAIVLLYTSANYAYESWSSGEGSPNPNGLPYFFPIKSVVPFAAALLILQGLVEAWRAVRQLRQSDRI